MKKRITKITVARIFLTIFVVIGHATYYSINTKYGGIYYDYYMRMNKVPDTLFHTITSYLTSFIYTFHMPLFIALSGILFEKQLKKGKYKNLSSLVLNKVKRLLIPLLFVWIFWNAPIKYLSQYYINKTIKDIALQILFPNSVYLWFLESLFISFIVVYLLKRYIKNSNIIFIVCIVFYFTQVLLDHITNNNVIFSKPFSSVLWFYLGTEYSRMKQYMNKWNLNNKKNALFAFVFHLFVFIIIEVLIYLNVDIHINLINYIVGLVYPLFSIIWFNYLIENISFYIDSNENRLKFINNIDIYSFGIYLYAEPLNYFFLYLAYEFLGISAFGNEIFAFILYLTRIIVSVAISIFIVNILKESKIKYLY